MIAKRRPTREADDRARDRQKKSQRVRADFRDRRWTPWVDSVGPGPGAALRPRGARMPGGGEEAEEGESKREGRSEEWRGGTTQHYAAIGPVARSRGTLARRTDATSRNSETCQTKDRCPEWDQEHRAHEAEHLLRR